MEKVTVKKARRVVAWCLRFIHNSNSQMLKIQRRLGPLTTEVFEKANNHLLINPQEGVDLNSRESTGFTLFNDGIVRCISRIQGEEPMFIPKKSIYATKLCEEKHKEVGHKGINITTAKVRKKYWARRLRAILKKEKRKCEKCKIMAAKPYPEPQRGLIPEKRVTAKHTFVVTGVDFVGPFHRKERKQEMKGYIVVFSCATSRAVYFAATRTMEAKELIDRLNELIVVYSRPQEIISDNAKTFKAGAKFIEKLQRSEEVHAYLSDREIKRTFILSKNPWRGAFYEKLNRDLKSIIFQKLGRSYLPFDRFCRVVKDTKIISNSLPLQYVEDEIGPRVLT